jgi:type I restriction enzyme S subunit
LAQGRFPVIGQGSEYIEGWTDREDLVLTPSPALVLYGGHTRRSKYVDRPFVPGPNVKILEPNKNLEPRFLHRFLEQLRIENRGYADHFPDVRRCVIPIPPLDEQRRIADILDKADAIRRKRKQAIALTEELLRSVFLEMFGDPVTNPKGWPVKPLSSLVAPGDSINYGVVQPGPETDVGVPLVRVGDFDGLSIDVRHLKKIQPDIEAAYTRSRLRGDEVLIACVGATLGKVALADKGLCGANIARAVARVRPSAALNRHYLALFLMMPFVQARFLAEARTVAQPTLNIRQIEQTPILAPPMSEQMAFARLHAQTTAVRARQLEAMNCAQELFRSLSARAFSADDLRSGAPC